MIRSSWADVQIPEATVHEHVLAGAAARGDHPALIDGRNGQTMTYAEFAHGVDRLAAGLAAAGLRPGHVLALFSPNTLLYPVVFHAALKAGATVTTVNALSTGKDLSAQLHDSGARFLVTISAFLDRVEQAAGQVEQIFLCDSFEGYQTIVGLMANDHPVPEVP